ncbi:MAG: response regulator transcription factor [Dehalococcoidales bacterium]
MLSSLEAANSREEFEVIKAGGGRQGLRLLFNQRPDLAMLDVVMPRMDGWQTCRRIREVSDVPVIILTGWCQAESDIIRGLDFGADDYLLKTIGNSVLVARVKAAIRRAELPPSPETEGEPDYDDGNLLVEIARRRVEVGGRQVKMTPLEFGLFALLVSNAGHVLKHQEILEKVWGWEYINDVDYVPIYIAHLRQKIEPEPSQPRYILTETGIGYCFQKAAERQPA